MSSGRRLGGWSIAVGVLGAACTIANPGFDQDGDGGQTGGSDGTVTAGDGTVTTGRPGDGPAGDGTVDGGTVDGGSVDGGSEGSTVCGSDDDCANGDFCDGAEICDPAHDEADGSGCIPANEPPCPKGANCSVEMQECVTDCEIDFDADQDGVDATECGGVDCDDANEFVYPGAPEECDEIDNDCDPSTLGNTDDDGDGEVSNACCNPVDSELVCGPDCDDSTIHIVEAGSDWSHCEACNQQCDVLQACEAGACIEARRVFVSSSVQAGDMGGLDGADGICQDLANRELGGWFRAYIRDAGTPVEDRLEQADVPYIRLDGTRIADDWGDLTDGDLQAPLSVDELREHHMEPPDRAWTGIKPDEAPWEGDCGGWMSNFDGQGAAGDVPQMGPSWEADGFPNPCGLELRLYCIEQIDGG